MELRGLNLIGLLLEMLESPGVRSSPNLMGAMITILTNMSLNDQNNVRIRLYGAHIIGAILMENCTTFNKERPRKYVRQKFILTNTVRGPQRQHPDTAQGTNSLS